MKRLILNIFLLIALTASAHDTVSVAVIDTIKPLAVTTDSIELKSNAVSTDSIPHRKKRSSWFWKAYYFIDGVLSPKRDPRYIDVQDYYNWCAMAQLSTKVEMFQMDSSEDDFMLRVAPESHLRFGPFFGWRFAFLGYNIDLKSIFSSSDDIDLGGSVYSAAFGLDLFYRRVGGDFNISKLKVGGIDYTPYLHGQPCKGVNLGMTRVSFYYIPNFRHYSHQAAFSQTHRQLISAGSLILGLQYAHNRCTIDWAGLTSMIRTYNPGIQLDDIAKDGSQKNDEFTATVGYGYNWVFAKNFLLGSEITGGLGYLVQHVETNTTDTGSSFSDAMRNMWTKHIAFDGSLRLALLYNNGPLYAGLQGVAFYYQHGNGSMMSRNFLATFYAMVGWNF